MQVTFRHTLGTEDTRSKTCAERDKPGVVWGVDLEFPLRGC